MLSVLSIACVTCLQHGSMKKAQVSADEVSGTGRPRGVFQEGEKLAQFKDGTVFQQGEKLAQFKDGTVFQQGERLAQFKDGTVFQQGERDGTVFQQGERPTQFKDSGVHQAERPAQLTDGGIFEQGETSVQFKDGGMTQPKEILVQLNDGVTSTTEMLKKLSVDVSEECHLIMHGPIHTDTHTHAHTCAHTHTLHGYTKKSNLGYTE